MRGTPNARSLLGWTRISALAEGWRAYRAALSQVAPQVRPYRGALALALLATLGNVAGRLLEPWPLKLIIDGVFLDHAPVWLAALGPDKTVRLGWLVAALVAIVALGATARYAQQVLSARIGLGMAHDLRTRLFAKAQSLSARFHGRRRSGDLVVRIMADIRILRAALIGMPLRFVREGLLMLGMVIVMLLIDWRLTLIAGLVLPVVGFLVSRYQGPMKAAIRQQRDRAGVIASTASEALGAVRVVQGYGAEKAEIKRFGKAAKKDLKSGLKTARLEGKLTWSTEIAVGFAAAAIAFAAVLRILDGALTPGDLIIFTGYMASFYQPIRRLARTLKRLYRAGAAGARISEILVESVEIADRPDALEMPPFSGEIRFEGVALRLGGRRVLDGIDLRIRAGEHAAILGPIGSGKTSLVSLIPRFYDPDEGRVTIDGTDLRALGLAGLRRQVAVAFQDPVIFAGTIAENIALGDPDAGRERIVAAAEACGMDRLIASLPDGFDTQAGERGRWLSGGQRQAVSLCRAMLREAPILILDEPTTGLDTASVGRMVRALQGLGSGRTVIMITHDIGSVAEGFRVIAMAGGRLTGSRDADGGTHPVRRELEEDDDRP